ncbi:MAG: glycosyltransferase family 2 protein [Bacteroidetes bacterium]|nr:glycosyltransferase family 2 protein [Bacteroidota bacterium]
MSDESRLTVIIPAFNEAENLAIILPPLIELCKQNDWKLIIVNDGSHDNTREILDSLIHPSPEGERPGVRLIHHKLNKGYGAAIKSGISSCDTEYCITIDADGQHRLEDIGRLFGCMKSKDADMVVGSRKGVKSATYSRGIGKIIIRFIAKMLMSVPVKDINSGMKVYRTELAKKYIHLVPDTMSYSDVITLIFINNRHLVLEEPITIAPRLKGKSTIRVETAFQTIMEIINIVILFNPAKIFLPLSAIFILAGIIVGLPFLLAGHGVSTGSLLGITAGIFFFLLGLVAEQLSALRKSK